MTPPRSTDGNVHRPPPGLPAAIFDLDGTLLDSAPGIAAAFNKLGVARRPVSVDEVRELVSFGAERLVGGICGLADPVAIAAALAAFRERYAADPCRPEDVYPGTADSLRALRGRGVLLGVCTNKPQRLAEIVVARLKLDDLLPVVIGAAPDRPAKPHPAPLREAVAALSGARAVFVGDSMVDAETAGAAGVAFIHARFGYGAIDPGTPCAASVDAMAEVPAVVARLLAPVLPHVA